MCITMCVCFERWWNCHRKGNRSTLLLGLTQMSLPLKALPFVHLLTVREISFCHRCLKRPSASLSKCNCNFLPVCYCGTEWSRHRACCGSGNHPASHQWVEWVLSLGIKEAEAWSWPLTSVCIRMRGIINLTPSYVLMARCLSRDIILPFWVQG